MTFDPGHIILALTVFALMAPALRLVPETARASLPFMAPPPAVFLAVEPTLPATQIARLDAIVMASVDKARHAERLHLHAYEQVDAADYALQGLKNELAAISSIVSGSAAPLRSVPSRGIPAPRIPTALAA